MMTMMATISPPLTKAECEVISDLFNSLYRRFCGFIRIRRFAGDDFISAFDNLTENLLRFHRAMVAEHREAFRCEHIEFISPFNQNGLIGAAQPEKYLAHHLAREWAAVGSLLAPGASAAVRRAYNDTLPAFHQFIEAVEALNR